jgi:hypothetical protein
MAAAGASAQGSAPGAERSARRALWIALAIYLALRGLMLGSDLDQVAIPVYEVGAMGNIAHIAQGGWEGAPLSQFFDNCGGHLATGLFAAPFFALLGDTFLALKLVPMLLGAAAIAIVWCIARRLAGPRAAAWVALLLAIGPAVLFKCSLLAMGSHFESLPFQMLALLTWLRWQDAPDSRRRALAFGAAAGFAVFFYFGSPILIAAIGLGHLALRGLRKSLVDGVRAIPGVLLGLAPLIAVQLATSGRPGRFLSYNLLGEEKSALERAWSRAADFFSRLLPKAGCFQDLGPIPARAAELLFLACFACAWCALAWFAVRGLRERWLGRGSAASQSGGSDVRMLLLPVVLYAPLWLVAYMFSGFTFRPADPPMEVLTYRYIVPPFWLACVGIALAAAYLPRRAGLALGAAALSTSAFTLPVIDWSFSRSDLVARYPGYHLQYYALLLLRDSEPDPLLVRKWNEAWIDSQVAEFPRREQSRILEGLGCMLTRTRLGPTSPETTRIDLDRLTSPYGSESALDVARGAGSGLRELASVRADRADWLQGILGELIARGDPRAVYVAEGLSQSFRYPQAISAEGDARLSDELRAGVPAELAGAWSRGRGIACGRLLGRGVEREVEISLRDLGRIDAAQRAEAWFGVGWGLGEELGERAGEAIARWAPQEQHGAAWMGVGAALRHVDGAGDPAASAPDLDPADRAAFALGRSWPSYPTPLALPSNDP